MPCAIEKWSNIVAALFSLASRVISILVRFTVAPTGMVHCNDKLRLGRRERRWPGKRHDSKVCRETDFYGVIGLSREKKLSFSLQRGVLALAMLE